MEASEDVEYAAMPKASCQRASVLLYLGKAGYDIKHVHTDGFTRAMSQVKWSIPNPFGSTTIDLFDGPTTDLLRQAIKDLRALYAIEPIFCHSEGHVLRRWLGILNCQVRSHRL